MKRGTVAVIGLLLLGSATPEASAQTTVQGAAVVRSGPVIGHVEVSQRRRVYYRPPVRDIIVVDRVHLPRRGHGWRMKHGYRLVTIYYDGRHYYRRVVRPHLRAVVVYERGGRYYLDEDYGRKKWHRDHDYD